METIGIIKKIDELGRIVIPKEIRKNLRIRPGDNFEVALSNEKIVLKKYSVLNKISDYANIFTDSIYSFLKKSVIITDSDSIIAVTGKYKKKYINKPISSYLRDCINRRITMYEKFYKDFELTNGTCENTTYVISPIISAGDSIGLVIVASDVDPVDEADLKVCQIVGKFLAKYLEE